MMNNRLDDVAPLDPGCPYCGSATPHPSSSPPGKTAAPPRPAPKSPVPRAKPEAVKVGSNPGPKAAPVPRADGKLAYDIFVEHIGTKEQAVPWEKLPDKAQRVWTMVARGVERRTVEVIAQQAPPRAG